jgi:metal-dependent hydrolase (beta-lactamase superfamily II)
VLARIHRDELPSETTNGNNKMNEHSATITSTTNHDETSYFNVLKSWSLGGIGTSILVESRMGTRIVLDVGSTPIFHDTVSANIVIISHGHLDHSGGMFSHARAHYLLFQKIPTYYMPLALVDKVRNVERALWELDSAQTDDDDRKNKISTSATPPPGLPITIVGVKPGDEILLSNTAQNER